MRSARPARLLALVLVVLSLLAALFASSVQAASAPYLNVTDVSTVNYPTVKLTFEVLGPDDLPITSLDRQAFAVSENGAAQTVISGYALQTSSTPLTVMLAIDTSLSMGDDGKLSQAQSAAIDFVSQMRPVDRVGLLHFDSAYGIVTPFTNDGAMVKQGITGLRATGNTRLYDGLYEALRTTAAADGSKAVVLLTDGQDTESAVDLPQILQQIRDTGIRVYPIGIGSDIDEGVLSQIAQVSGGHLFRAPTTADIGNAFRLMSNQLRNRYEVVYSSPTAAQGSTVQVRLTAQTPAGQAVGQTSYVAPAYVGAARSGAAGAGQPQAAQSTAAAALRNEYALGGLVSLGVLLAAAGLALSQSQRWRQARLAYFVAGIGGTGVGEAEVRSSPLGALLVPLLQLVARLVSHMLRPAKVQSVSRQLLLAGNPYGWRVSHFVAARFLLGAGVALLTALFTLRSGQPLMTVLLMAVFGFLGYRLPVFWLKRRIKKRQNAIRRALPDALDLLTISVEAGLGLDGAMLEVVNKWDNALSDDFAVVLAELKMGRSRREALRSLAERSGVEEVRIFTSAMVQADELGMGVARPLALQAEQLRLKRRQHAERLAREAGIKMVVTMGLLIMPALFLILVSPAAVQLMSFFGH